MVSAAAGRREADADRMSIGDVLAVLRPDFPDVSISKIRFLEEQGLVEPQRTASGYRKFSHLDVDRLRYVLAVQRDHYLPLRVIREHLAAVDAGMEPPILPGFGPGVPRLVDDSGRGSASRPAADHRLTRAQLMQVTGADEELMAALESHGLVWQQPGRGGFDPETAVVVRAAVDLAEFGIEPRHLRQFRAAADREAGLVEQVILPLRRQRNPESAARAEEVGREVAGLCLRLHAALVASVVNRASR